MAVVRHHNGVEYVEHAVTPAPVAATFRHNGTKIKVDGPCSVVEMSNSYKYGHELHFTVHWPGSPWGRIEIAMPYDSGVQLLKRAVDSIKKRG